MRRFLIIIAVIIVLLGIGGFVWWRYFSGGPSLAVSQAPATSAALPTAGNASGAPVSTATGGSGSALQATKVSARLTKIAVGPIVPGEAVVDMVPTPSVSTKGAATGTPAVATTTSTLGAETAVEFIERQSGNIFTYGVRSGMLTRTSNKTIPGIVRASWLPSGARAYVTYLSGDTLSTINTYGIGADGTGGFFLPTGLADLAVSSESLLALASGATGSVASVIHADGTGSATAFTSPLSMLRIGFAGKTGYIAFTKPAGSLDGALFFISLGGSFTRLAGPLPGLVALPNHSGSMVLVSTSAGAAMRMFLVDTSSGTQTPLPIATIADKCVWTADDVAVYCGVPSSPPAAYTYPDDWYQGAVHFSDRLWRIDVRARLASMVLDPSSTPGAGQVDAEALAIDPNASVLVFVNKNDGSLWSYSL